MRVRRSKYTLLLLSIKPLAPSDSLCSSILTRRIPSQAVEAESRQGHGKGYKTSCLVHNLPASSLLLFFPSLYRRPSVPRDNHSKSVKFFYGQLQTMAKEVQLIQCINIGLGRRESWPGLTYHLRRGEIGGWMRK